MNTGINSHSLQANEQAFIKDQRPTISITSFVDTIYTSDQDQKDGRTEEDDENLGSAADFSLFPACVAFR